MIVRMDYQESKHGGRRAVVRRLVNGTWSVERIQDPREVLRYLPDIESSDRREALQIARRWLEVGE
jgi:hypothetical protein